MNAPSYTVLPRSFVLRGSFLRTARETAIALLWSEVPALSGVTNTKSRSGFYSALFLGSDGKQEADNILAAFGVRTWLIGAQRRW